MERNSLYLNSGGGFVRKAISNLKQENQNFDREGRFKDNDFFIPKSENYFLTRIFDLYDEEVDMFPENDEPSMIE